MFSLILSDTKFDKTGLYTDEERNADKINDQGYLLGSGRINKVWLLLYSAQFDLLPGNVNCILLDRKVR